MRLSLTGPLSTITGTSEAILAALRSGIAPAGSLMNLGKTDDGITATAIVPNVDLTNGSVDVELNTYIPGVNHTLSLAVEDTGIDAAADVPNTSYGYLLVEDASLPEADGAILANLVANGVYVNGVVNNTNTGLAQMPTPTSVVDRLRLMTPDGTQYILDATEIFDGNVDVSRLSISAAMDTITGTEYAVVVAEGSNQVYIAEMKPLATAPDAATALALFTAGPPIKTGEVERLNKPSGDGLGISLSDGRTAILSIANGVPSIEVPPLSASSDIDTEADPAQVATLEPNDGVSAEGEMTSADDDANGMSASDDTGPTGTWGISMGLTSVEPGGVPTRGWVKPAADSVTLRLAQVA